VTLVPPPVISRFGDWNGAGGLPRPWQHAGVDIRAATGTPILAAAPGTVLRTGWGPFAGRYVLLVHAPDLGTAYYHLSEIGVVAGQRVGRGEPIGRAGMTGNATTAHLHFGACRRDGGACGGRIGEGWVDPVTLWAEPNPCFVAGRAYPAEPARLTYPVPCSG
jgi:murein DD-endopeptidase MepM/ murein hydrolase activator NlpD